MTKAEGRFSVLIVDDEPEMQELLRDAIRAAGNCEVAEPSEVDMQSLRGADLVLVDLTLDQAGLDRPELSLAQRPKDGLALAAVLRSHLPHVPDSAFTAEGDQSGPTAFALHTSHIAKLVPDLPTDVGEHVAAHLNNLEWVFRKQENLGSLDVAPPARPLLSSRVLEVGPSRLERVVSLAEAAASLPERWNSGSFEDSSQMLRDHLGLPDAPWGVGAEEHARSCHPPLFEVAADSQGLAFLRWLLHRILPYPCFLIDSHYLALKLQLEHTTLAELLATVPTFADVLDSALYRGLLADFTGPRWWASGVEAAVFRLTDGDLFDRGRLRQALDSAAGKELSYNSDSSVLCLNSDYRPISVVERSAAVRVQPDDWPPFAEQAYAAIAEASGDGHLRRLVVLDDMALLDDE